MDAAAYIRERLSMEQVAQFYGFRPNRGGYIACPFHGDETPSLKIYSTPGRGWHCYGCGAGGTAIDFVMQLFKIPFAAAVVRLNADFHLGLTSTRPDDGELRRLRETRRREEAEKEQREARIAANCAEHRAAWQTAKVNAPRSANEEISQAYADAVKRLPVLDYRLEVMGY